MRRLPRFQAALFAASRQPENYPRRHIAKISGSHYSSQCTACKQAVGNARKRFRLPNIRARVLPSP
ncbi:hypothetical protein [Kingella sp. (in: b-proteobacteria)]|uniref:hypothetical protein n=1 Tax=Kingella sp. (in: b-proteobacteria) TaxID=2020713 RepID=UPI0026DBFA46|nr:hypothetical protein [Kingella sp. (in: b-proteobacteria)]MDO4656693.1 hypothetical protein [Kingella sp. (in: b-proteobacteria)]